MTFVSICRKGQFEWFHSNENVEKRWRKLSASPRHEAPHPLCVTWTTATHCDVSGNGGHSVVAEFDRRQSSVADVSSWLVGCVYVQRAESLVRGISSRVAVSQRRHVRSPSVEVPHDQTGRHSGADDAGRRSTSVQQQPVRSTADHAGSIASREHPRVRQRIGWSKKRRSGAVWRRCRPRYWYRIDVLRRVIIA